MAIGISVRQRIREPQFWLVQLGVGLATAAHVTTETSGLSGHERGIELGLHHLPIVLYLFPVTYAGITYGREGGLFTGLWSALLVVPTLFVWHRSDFDWLGELLFVFVVVGVGLLAARPVERERRQRREVEAIARRLGLVNDLAARLGDGPAPDALAPTIDQLVETMDLAGAEIHARTARAEPFSVSRASAADASPAATVPLGPDGEHDRLLVFTKPGQRLDTDDLGFLRTVAAEIGFALDRARRNERERLELERYARNVTRAQEEERGRIARDLHDDAAQALVALSQKLDQLAEQARRSGGATDALDGLRTLAGEVLTSVRGYSRELRPTILDDLGLIPALEWLVDEAATRAQITGRVAVEGTPRRLEGDAGLALFRIAQEAVRNVERHASASDVTISVTFDTSTVRLEVVDDGVGFVQAEASPESDDGAGLGVLGMRERAQLAGGTFAITALPGGGTGVRAELPA